MGTHQGLLWIVTAQRGLDGAGLGPQRAREKAWWKQRKGLFLSSCALPVGGSRHSAVQMPCPPLSLPDLVSSGCCHKGLETCVR